LSLIPWPVLLDHYTQTIAATPLPEYFSPNVIARLAANARLNEIKDQQDATDLAVRYQLMTQYTALAIVDVREEKIKDLPELRTVPQMQAAGWGGCGSTNDLVMYCDSPSQDSGSNYLDIPSFLRRSNVVEEELCLQLNITPVEFAERVAGHAQYHDEWTVTALKLMGLEQLMADWLADLVTDPALEQAIVACFLYQLMHALKGQSFDRQTARIITKAHKQYGTNGYDTQTIQQRMASVTESDWHMFP
jgi:hypothetical protein